MCKINSLYTLLKSQEKHFSSNDAITHAVTLDDKEYYRIHLNPFQKADARLFIEEAHLSVYKDVDHQNPRLDASHITLYCRDASATLFRAHFF